MAPRIPARNEIVRALVEAGRPLHARELAATYGVKQNGFARFLTLLDQLAEAKVIRRFSGQRFAAKAEPAVESGERWEGALALNPRGFGFVTAPGRDDVYVAPDGIGNAMHGDRVSV